MNSLIEKLEQLEHEADAFGFSWEQSNQIIDQIKDECEEIQYELQHDGSREKLQEEIGDLIHAVFSLCCFHQFSGTETLSLSIDKFEKRLNKVKVLAKADGLETLKGKSFKELMYYWQQAK